jgi:hypothetical protein
MHLGSAKEGVKQWSLCSAETMSQVAPSSPRGQSLLSPPSIFDRVGQDQTDRHVKIKQFKATLRETLSRGMIDEKQARTSALQTEANMP